MFRILIKSARFVSHIHLRPRSWVAGPIVAVLVLLLLSASVSAQIRREKPSVDLSPRALALMDGAARRLQRSATIAATIHVKRRWRQRSWNQKTIEIRAQRHQNALWTQTLLPNANDRATKKNRRVLALQDDTLWHYGEGPIWSDGYTDVTLSGTGHEAWRVLGAMARPLGAFFSAPGDHSIVDMAWLPSRRNDPTNYALVDEEPMEWQGRPVEVVRWTKLQMAGAAPAGTPGGSYNDVIDTTRYYIATDPDTVIVRVVSTSSSGVRTEVTVADLRLDQLLPASAIAWTAPPAAKRKVDADEDDEGASPGGASFPDFALAAVDSTGAITAVTLEQALAGKQALLVWVWAAGCSSCREEFPYMQALAEEMGPRGVAVMAKDYARLDRLEVPEYELASRVLQYQGAPMTILLDPDDAQIDIKKFGSPGRYASAVIVDAHKRIRWGGSARDLVSIRRVLNELAPPR